MFDSCESSARGKAAAEYRAQILMRYNGAVSLIRAIARIPATSSSTPSLPLDHLRGSLTKPRRAGGIDETSRLRDNAARAALGNADISHNYPFPLTSYLSEHVSSFNPCATRS